MRWMLGRGDGEPGWDQGSEVWSVDKQGLGGDTTCPVACGLWNKTVLLVSALIEEKKRGMLRENKAQFFPPGNTDNTSL